MVDRRMALVYLDCMDCSVDSPDGTQLVYSTRGEGEVTLVFVHGWMVTGRVWDDLLPHVADRGRRCIVPDLRGAGRSAAAATDYALDRYAEDVVAVLEHAAPRGGAALIGHSMGGQIAQAAAARRPDLVDRLVLVSSVPIDGLALPDDALGLFRSAAEDVGARETVLKLASPNASEEIRAALLADAAQVDPKCFLEAIDTFRLGADAERLTRIRAATLVVASDDPFLPPAFLEEKIVKPIADARLTHIPGAGHYIENEKPAELGRLICSFLGDGTHGSAG